MYDEYKIVREIENDLRSIIIFALEIKYGNNWMQNLKISKEKIKSWEAKKEEESKRFRNNISESRLIYYSEFYDLKIIIEKHWDDIFSEIFLDKKEFDVLFDIVAGFRNNIAHNRELLEHQIILLKGISERFKYSIMQFKADRDNEDSYYPKFENVLIDGINIVDVMGSIDLHKKKYHVGDRIEVIVNSICPPDIEVEYAIKLVNRNDYSSYSNRDFSKENRVSFILKDSDIPNVKIKVAIRSNSTYHRNNGIDGDIEHYINVLPNK